jgi:pyrroloquinoline quinone (PQQ) biosynthesis protein C
VQPGQDIEVFVAELQAEIDAKQLSLIHSNILAAVESGTATRAQIAAWAKAFYAATRNGRLHMGNFYANSPEDVELRRELAANLYEEETGNLSGVGKCHMDVFADFLEALAIGAHEASAAKSPFGDQPVQGRPIPPERFYIELAAYGLSVETPNSEFCARIYKALKTNYGFDDHQLGWFSMHVELDADHGEEFRKYVARAASYPGGLEDLRALTLRQCEVIKAMWNGGGSWERV